MSDGTNTTTSSGTIHPRQRIIHNFPLVWIDAGIDESKQDWQNTFRQLRSVVNDVHIFAKRDEGIDFLTEVHGMKASLIVSGALSQQIVPLIHDIPQLDTIYIFCDKSDQHDKWTKEWTKIKGVHTDVMLICQVLEITIKQCNQDSIAVSFVTASEGSSIVNLNQLEPSFMYTQIFKEILLEIEHNEHSIEAFLQFWRADYIDNIVKLKDITEFERDYHAQSAIKWYTRESFIYQILNQALRLLEADTIINMGFFIRDLHLQIEQLYREQVGSYGGKPFIVYRGQGLSTTDFEKLQKTKGGLMSFNNFLSTSKEQDVSLDFAHSASINTDMVGILFKMTIDPSISSAPFASIGEFSHFQREEEILFSMHTIFRIGEITKIGNHSSLYEVNLKLTADDDQELRKLTECIREKIVGATGWSRLGQLLIKLSQFDKAEEVYNMLLDKTSDEDEKATYYNNLGQIKDNRGDYEKAVEYHRKALEIRQQTLPADHPLLATYYNNIGSVYYKMGEYSKALSFYEKSLEIKQKTLPLNHPLWATSYNNIGLVYYNMGEYSKALSFYEKALEIRRKTLPANHPLLATYYNNIGLMYYEMGENSKALSFYEKDLEICQKTLPASHPDFAYSYNNIASLYDNMGEHWKALSSYQRALSIFQNSLPTSHPNIKIVQENIDRLKEKL